MSTLTVTISNIITFHGVTYQPGQIVTMDAADARSLVNAGYAQYGGGGTDTVAPSPPPLVIATVQGPTSVAVTWGSSIDNVGVVSYRISRNGVQIATVGPDTYVYTDTAAPTGTGGLAYSVTAVDPAGNASVPGQASPVSTPIQGGGEGGDLTGGVAGGDLTGTYPNPMIAYRAVTMDKISAQGSPGPTTFLRGDGQWMTPAAGDGAGGGAALDTTPADIQPTTTGLPDAGSTGQAADAGHKHPLGGHSHQDFTTGGTIGIGALAMGGTPSASTFLRGDGQWAVPPQGGGGTGVLLDTTPADIQPVIVGAAAAGGTGKAADAGHRHPLSAHSHLDAANGGTITVAAINATGARSTTTFLRGDGQWTTVTATIGANTVNAAALTTDARALFVNKPAPPAATSVVTVAPDGTTGLAQLGSVVPGLTIFKNTDNGRYGFDTSYVPNNGDIVPPPDPVDPTKPTPTAQYPAQVIDLRGWKETLPTNGSHSGAPDEYVGTELQTFVDPKNFYVGIAADDGSNVIIFHADVGGYTTSASSYPRSELREMATNADGSLKMSGTSPVNASWGVNDGKTHTMEYVLAFQTVPPGDHARVCGGQIHNASDDVIEILRDDTVVAGKSTITYRFRGQTQATHLLEGYVPGSFIRIKIVGGGGAIRLYCLDMANAKATHTGVTDTGCYFKVGSYVQSNLTYNKAGDYGQTALKSVTVTHA